MKTTSLIPPALLITGLLLSGCSGLDDPDDGDGGGSTPSEFEGAYTFEVTVDVGICSDDQGVMQVDADGDVTSTTLNDGFDDFTLSGLVVSNGFIEGDFDFTVAGHAATYDGVMSTTTTECGGNVTVKGGGGTWGDTSTGCSGTWTACP